MDHILTDYLSNELTESTELTKLQRPTNCSFTLKPLPIQFFLLTPLPLPVSLLLPSSVNFLLSLISSRNLSCLYLGPECKVSSHLLIVTKLSIDKIDSSLKQGKKGKVILIESVSSKNSSKNGFSASIPIYS